MQLHAIWCIPFSSCLGVSADDGLHSHYILHCAGVGRDVRHRLGRGIRGAHSAADVFPEAGAGCKRPGSFVLLYAGQTLNPTPWSVACSCHVTQVDRLVDKQCYMTSQSAHAVLSSTMGNRSDNLPLQDRHHVPSHCCDSRSCCAQVAELQPYLFSAEPHQPESG